MPHSIKFPVFVGVWNRLQNTTTPRVHYKIAKWLNTAWEEGRTRLLLNAFRSCGKSTIVGLYCVWLLWQNPNLRILVVAADTALAVKMVRQVKRIIEKHPLTKNLKPKSSDQWGSDRFTVKRHAEWRDPSVLAKGISANLTGTRADVIICDDVEVPKTCSTEAKREELRNFLKELDFILVPQGTIVYVGTPHHFDTIYRTKSPDKNKAIVPFLDGFDRLKIAILNKFGNSVWPERFSLEKIHQIQKSTGPNHFQSQMMLEPVNIIEGRLDVRGIQYYKDEINLTEANQSVQLSIGHRKMISGVAWWDPAFAAGNKKGDESILAIVYLDDQQNYFLHHIESIKITGYEENDEATAQCKIVAACLKNFHIPMIAIETNGLGKFLPGILRREIARTQAGATVMEATSRKPKDIRILESFDVVLAARSLYLREGQMMQRFYKQLGEWSPKLTHADDDMIDAVAGALTLQPARFRSSLSTHCTKPKWTNTAPVISNTGAFDI